MPSLRLVAGFPSSLRMDFALFPVLVLSKSNLRVANQVNVWMTEPSTPPLRTPLLRLSPLPFQENPGIL